MDITLDAKAWIGIVLLLVLVVGVNAAIFAGLRHNNTQKQIGILGRVGRRLRNPYEAEDDMLEQLSGAVRQIQPKDDTETGSKA